MLDSFPFSEKRKRHICTREIIRAACKMIRDYQSLTRPYESVALSRQRRSPSLNDDYLEIVAINFARYMLCIFGQAYAMQRRRKENYQENL